MLEPPLDSWDRTCSSTWLYTYVCCPWHTIFCNIFIILRNQMLNRPTQTNNYSKKEEWEDNAKRMAKKSDSGMELQSCVTLLWKEHNDTGKRKNLSKQRYMNDYGCWILASSWKSHIAKLIRDGNTQDISHFRIT